MAKMRGIKPETFTDSRMVRLSPLARYLFIGLWTLACDNGHVDDDTVEIKMRLLPADNADVDALLDEIAAGDMISREDGVLTVLNLTKHQRIDRRYFRTCDKPGCLKPGGTTTGPQRDHDETTTSGAPNHAPDTTGPQRDHDGATTSTRRDHDETTTGPRRDHVDEGEGEGEGERKDLSVTANAATPTKNTYPDAFEKFWTAYPRKAGKAAALRAWQRARKTVTEETLLNAAARYAGDPNREDAFTAHASTWLSQGRWDDEPLPPRPTSQDRAIEAARRDLENYGPEPVAEILEISAYPWEA